jgi:hypothetical protein
VSAILSLLGLGVRKPLICGYVVPLIERLSNRETYAELDRLPCVQEAAGSVGQCRSCRCGCMQPVTGTRIFVSQDHYSVWLSRQRSFGRHRKQP